MGKLFKHLSQNDRIKMETMLNSGHKVVEVAECLHVHRSTIYREIKRGEYTHRNSDYTEETRYSSDLGQKNHDWNAQGKGRNIKIGNDRPLAEYIEGKIIEDKYSPEAAVRFAVYAKNADEEFDAQLSEIISCAITPKTTYPNFPPSLIMVGAATP